MKLTQVVELFRQAAKYASVNATFLHGNYADGSQISADAQLPLIHLLPPHIIKDIPTGVQETEIVLLCLFQDSLGSSPEQHEQILQQGFDLAERIVNILYIFPELEINRISLKPARRIYTGPLSGCAASFSIRSIGFCSDEQFEYMLTNLEA